MKAKIKKKKYVKLEKCQGLRGELENKRRIKATVVPVAFRALTAVTPKLGEWFQQVPGVTFKICPERTSKDATHEAPRLYV